MATGGKMRVDAAPQPGFGTQAPAGATSVPSVAEQLARSPAGRGRQGASGRIRRQGLAPTEVAIAAARQRYEAGEATLVALAAELDAEFGVGPGNRSRGEQAAPGRAGTGMSARRLGALRKSQGWLEPARRAPAKPAVRQNASVRIDLHDLAADEGGFAGQATSQRPPGLVGRLWAAAGRHMSEIEAAMAGAPGDVTSREREARLMAMLVRVAAGLAALERSTAQHGEAGGNGTGNGTGKGAGKGISKGISKGMGTVAGEGDEADDAIAGLPDDLDGFRLALEERIAALRQCGVADVVSEPVASTRSGAAGG